LNILLGSFCLLILSGLAARVAAKSFGWSTAFGAGGAVTACAAGLYPVGYTLLTGKTQTLHVPWNIPFGSFFVQIDPLSGFFLLPVLVLSGLSAIYGAQYLKTYRDVREMGSHWFFFNLLVAGMLLVLLARNGMLFLIAWEVMSLAPFFLVLFEGQKKSAQKAAWTYLVAAHLGGIALILLFILMGWGAGTLDFDRLSFPGGASVVSAGWLFLLAVIGFGAKAGFIPLHVWLPEAHPAAPSHVSAVMSGVMIKMGIYGLLRTLTLLGRPPAWWGYLLICIGLTSGILGVLFALAQHDLKRLLAYHSVENIGIITLGLGVGVLGVSMGSPVLAVLGFGGGLLHVINHALFKGLLFLGAGSVLHGAHTMEIDHLGGLMKRMPWTGTLFLIGAAAICGLPPLNGFVSEFLIYQGAFHGVLSLSALPAGTLVGSIAGLAMIGGLAAACFTKAFGIVFLGEPRSGQACRSRETGMAMRIPMLFLAGGCIFIGLAAPWAAASMGRIIQGVTSLPSDTVFQGLALAQSPLTRIVHVAQWLLLSWIVLFLARRFLLSSRPIGKTVTWNCGYTTSSPRMQYTASSFARPLTDLFKMLLQTRKEEDAPQGLFPGVASLSTETPDLFRRFFYEPVFSSANRLLSGLKWLQHGRVQLYILYIVVTLFVVFIWKFI